MLDGMEIPILTRAQYDEIGKAFISNYQGDVGFMDIPALPAAKVLAVANRFFNGMPERADMKAAAILLNHCPYVQPEKHARGRKPFESAAFALYPVLTEMKLPIEQSMNIKQAYGLIRSLLGEKS